MPGLLIFDLDGTLIPLTGYDEANAKCVAIFRRVFDGTCPSAADLIAEHRVLDFGLMETWLYDEERFPQSWGMFYLRLADRYGRDFDPNVHGEILNAARHFRAGPFRTFPDAIPTLAELHRRSYQQCLVTSGKRAERLQWQKIDEADLRRFFPVSRVTITGSDKTADFQRLIAEHGQPAWVIGDSPKHDIVVGRRVGARTILVGQSNWPHMQAEVSPDYVVPCLSGILRLLS